MSKGYTGSRYEPAGIVHHAEAFGPWRGGTPLSERVPVTYKGETVGYADIYEDGSLSIFPTVEKWPLSDPPKMYLSIHGGLPLDLPEVTLLDC